MYKNYFQNYVSQYHLKDSFLSDLVFYSFVVLLYALFIPSLAMAATPTITASDNALVGVICKLVAFILGPAGKGVATISLIVVFIGIWLGKFNWGMITITGIGVAGFFGSATLVSWLSAGEAGELTCADGTF